MTWPSKQSFYRETTNTILPQCTHPHSHTEVKIAIHLFLHVITYSFILLPISDTCWSFRTCSNWWEVIWWTSHSTDENWRTPPSTSPSGSSTLDRQCPSELLAMPGGWQLTFQELCFRVWHFTFWLWGYKDFKWTQHQDWSEMFSPDCSLWPIIAFASGYTESRATSATLVGLYIS